MMRKENVLEPQLTFKAFGLNSMSPASWDVICYSGETEIYTINTRHF